MIQLPSSIVQKLKTTYEGKHVCVTGGAGFIGGHLVDALVSLGARVNVIDDLSNSTSEHLVELMSLEPDHVRFECASILEPAPLRQVVDQAAIVFHLAAQGSVPMSVEEPERSFDINATGTMRVAEAARLANVPRIVYSASSSAYGASEKLPKLETDTPQPISPYAAGKLAGEHVMTAWAHSYGMQCVSLRYFNIFGPRQSADSAYAAVIAAFAKAMLAGNAPTIFGDGTQSRDFTYVANAVLANLLAGATTTPLTGQIVNIGTGRRVDLLELARVMAESCGSPHLVPSHQPTRAGDVKHSLADITEATNLLGYNPITTLEDGMAATIDWCRQAYAPSSHK